MQSSILIATTNNAKYNESIRYLTLPGVAYKSLSDFPHITPYEEGAETFEQNAIAKAKYYATHSNIPTLASDGGLCIDALDGAPGVHSRRWSGKWTDDAALNNMVLEKLRGVPYEKRGARLEGAIVFVMPHGETITAHAAIEGVIAETLGPYPPGFPYRGLLLVEPYKKYYSELTPEEHEQINHWRRALEELRPQILDLLA